jgi:peroxiredoxin-like protein
MAEETHTYATSLRWTSQRQGALAAPGLPGLTVATPPPFPGGQPGIWSPEHLFVAAAEACLMTTFLAIAENSKLDFVSYASEAEGTVARTDQGYLVTEIRIRPRVVVRAEGSRERAQRIVEKAEQHCLISKSMKTRVAIEPDVTVGG